MGRKRYAWLTGDTPPSPEELCRRISVPSDLPLVTAITGALLPLTNPSNWQQQGTMTPEEAADIMSAALDAFLSSTCQAECPPIQLPDGNRIYRRNPTTKRFEYVDTVSGEWIEPSGEEALPSPTPREETTEDDRLCAAAANAVHCLKVTLEAVLDEWEAFSPPAQAITTMVTGIVGWAGAAFYPPMLAYVLLVEAAFNLFYEMMDAISWNFWDGNFEQALVCSLKSNATDTDGVITFDYDAVVSDLWAQLWTRGEYVLLVTQVQYLLWVIGQQGLDIAGTTTAVTGDCSDCGTWCYEGRLYDTNFTIQAGYWTQDYKLHCAPYDGNRWASGSFTVDTSNCVIKRVALYVEAAGGTTGNLEISVTPSNGPLYYYGSSEALGGIGYWRYTEDNLAFYTTGDTTTVYVMGRYWSGLGDRNLRFSNYRLYGTGTSPFGASNC